MFVTTPIYYVNDAPHIGHAYTTILADVLCRYHRLWGDETFFLTGTDEHGQKVEQSAKKRGVEPQAHCDEFVERFKTAWKELDVCYDFFIRTTMDAHKRCVMDCLEVLYEKGEIYQGEYQGWYSESEEMFFAADELIDGKSPLGKPVVEVRERNYFFRMGKYQERLVAYIEDHPDFILPKGKRSEVLGFLRQPLADLCISRPKSRLAWGVPLPFDGDFVTYVWFDALINYVSALGYNPRGKSNSLFDKFWPSATHLIGKDILTTHAVYWPTMLMALELPLPRHIMAHGWWLTSEDKKMSKSEGQVVRPLDMKDIVGVYGLRYFLMRAMNPASDGQFSAELVVGRVNAELANNLGNLFSRTLGLLEKNCGLQIPASLLLREESKALAVQAVAVATSVRETVEGFTPNRGIEEVLELLSATNRFVDEWAPWKEFKEGRDASECLYVALEVLRISAILLSPVMPEKCKDILGRLNVEGEPTFEDAKVFSKLNSGSVLCKGEPLFPRVEVEAPTKA